VAAGPGATRTRAGRPPASRRRSARRRREAHHASRATGQRAEQRTPKARHPTTRLRKGGSAARGVECITRPWARQGTRIAPVEESLRSCLNASCRGAGAVSLPLVGLVEQGVQLGERIVGRRGGRAHGDRADARAADGGSWRRHRARRWPLARRRGAAPAEPQHQDQAAGHPEGPAQDEFGRQIGQGTHENVFPAPSE